MILHNQTIITAKDSYLSYLEAFSNVILSDAYVLMVPIFDVVHLLSYNLICTVNIPNNINLKLGNSRVLM